MSDAVRILIIVSAVIVLVLLAGFICGAFFGLSSFVVNEYAIKEDINRISVIASTADIKILPSPTGEGKVVCREYEKMGHRVSALDGELLIERFDERKWYEFLSFNFRATGVTVYLPEKEYSELFIKTGTSDVEVSRELSFGYAEISVSTGDVEFFAPVKDTVTITASTGDIELRNPGAEAVYLKTSTGDIDVSGGEVGAIELSVSTGEIEVSDIECEFDVIIRVSTGDAEISRVSCRDLISEGNTGDIDLYSVTASGKFDIVRSTGDVKFINSDAAELFIETDTGDVSGTLLTSKIFITDTNTGKVRVPDSVIGGRCEIKTSTGNIIISVK